MTQGALDRPLTELPLYRIGIAADHGGYELKECLAGSYPIKHHENKPPGRKAGAP
jgi:hypothetical protein